jgi:hypothetical protein
MCTHLLVGLALLLGADPSTAPAPIRDYTVFQTGSGFVPQIDIGSDIAVVYGVDDSFADRLAGWKAQGYGVSMMTGISWGQYAAYYGGAENLKKEEIQTSKSGRLYMHGNSKTVGYNVPTPAYVEFIKQRIAPAIDLGVQAIYLEEPEYWAETGWSEGFKRAWQDFYDTPWEAPDSSVDAQYKASRLKYELYFNALRDVFQFAKARAKEQGKTLECHVPTHSLLNYAHWRIVSPESRLMDLPEVDGYIAQVWTGTARTPNVYQGERKERTFETAFLEYGQALGMVRPTGRKVWFLHDPIEDNPNYSWANYRKNYEDTVVASLFWPEVHRFEVMPWPNRIFQGTYPKVDLDAKSGDREGIPAEYATEILTVINALNDMEQQDVHFDAGSNGIGILVSDTLMFQRAAPTPSEPHLSSFYGLALPLLKAGIPLEPVQLETILTPEALTRYRVLVLTYEGQKPLKPEYHAVLDTWVRAGGCLLYVGDKSDPYHHVKAWWNQDGTTDAVACDDLFQRLGLDNAARHKPVSVGEGYARIFFEKPRELAKYPDGASKVLAAVEELLQAKGLPLETQNYFSLRRGPYLIAAVLDESLSSEHLALKGRFVDLFDPHLPIVRERALAPGERALWYDLDWQPSALPRVVAAGARVRAFEVQPGALQILTRGPAQTHCRLRVQMATAPTAVSTVPEVPVQQVWDPESGTVLLSFDNQGADIRLTLTIP